MPEDPADTATLEAKPLAEGATTPPLSEEAAATATLESPSEGTETKPGDGPASPEGEGGDPKPETPPAPAWAAISDREELFAHEEIAPHITEREDAARNTGRTEALETMRESYQEREGRLNRIDGSMNRFLSSFHKLTRAGPEGEAPAISATALGDLMEEHSEAFAALTGEHQEAGKWVGAAGLINGLAEAAESEDFGNKFRARLTKMQRGLSDPAIFTDMVSAISAAAKKPLQEEIKELNAKVERVGVEARAEKRNGTEPPATPAGTAGGGSIDNSDTARLDRLAYGQDSKGNRATDEDRAWIAARGN